MPKSTPTTPLPVFLGCADSKVIETKYLPVVDFDTVANFISPSICLSLKNLTHPTFGTKNLYSSKLIFTDCGILNDCLLCFDLNFGKPFFALKKF